MKHFSAAGMAGMAGMALLAGCLATAPNTGDRLEVTMTVYDRGIVVSEFRPNVLPGVV